MWRMRDYASELRADLRLHKRAFCYLNGTKAGYVVPVKDKMARRPWAWVACDMYGEILGVSKDIEEARALCVTSASRKVRQFAIERVMEGRSV